MRVTVKLAGGFVHTVGFSQNELDLEPGATVDDILVAIHINRAWPMIVVRNGWAVPVEEELRDGDRILVCPVFSGG